MRREKTRLPRRSLTLFRDGRFVRAAALLVTLAVSSVEGEAFALQGGEDPALLPVLLDKRFGLDGAHQLSIAFSTAIAAKFVEATGAFGSYTYNFSDLLGFELGGGFFFGRESSIM